MIYKIFEVREKAKRTERLYNDTEYSHRLLTPTKVPPMMRDTFSSPQEAEAELQKFTDDLKQRTFTILPIIHISWDGEIQQP